MLEYGDELLDEDGEDSDELTKLLREKRRFLNPRLFTCEVRPTSRRGTLHQFHSRSPIVRHILLIRFFQAFLKVYSMSK